MLARVLSAAVNGIEAFPVEVEVNNDWGDTIVVIVVNNSPKAEQDCDKAAFPCFQSNDTQALSSMTSGIFWCSHQSDKSPLTRSHWPFAQSGADASHLAAVGKNTFKVPIVISTANRLPSIVPISSSFHFGSN
jgi:hypothetical protein